VADATRASLGRTSVGRRKKPRTTEARLMRPDQLPQADREALKRGHFFGVGDSDVRAEMPDARKMQFAPQRLMGLSKAGQVLLNKTLHRFDQFRLNNPQIIGDFVARDVRAELALSKKTLASIPDRDVKIIGDAFAAKKFGYNATGEMAKEHVSHVAKDWSDKFQEGYRFARETQASDIVSNTAEANKAAARGKLFKDDSGKVISEIPDTPFDFHEYPRVIK